MLTSATLWVGYSPSGASMDKQAHIVARIVVSARYWRLEKAQTEARYSIFP
jgi:hypothetical protein